MPTRTFRGTTDSNWGTATNWLEGVVPTNLDDVVFDATSPNCTVQTSTRSAKTLTCTNYTNTITLNNALQVSGSITLGASMSFAGAQSLQMLTTGTLTTNGKTINVQFIFAGNAQTYTISGTATFSNTLTTSATITVNGGTINIGANYVISASFAASGTTLFKFTGTGSWSGNFTVRNPIEINTAGTLTISGAVQAAGTAFTYTAGAVVTTGSTVNFGATMSISAAGMDGTTTSRFNAVTFSGATVTFTLLAHIYINGTLTSSVTLVSSITGAFNMYCYTNVTIGASGLTGVSTATLVFAGSGAWTMSTGAITCNIQFNTAGTITCGATTLGYSGGTMTYISGTIDTGTSTLSLAGSCTLDTAGIDWYNVTIGVAVAHVITLGSTLRVTNVLTHTGVSGAGNVWAGTAAWDCNTFTSGIAVGRTYTLGAGLTYVVRSSIIMSNGTLASPSKFQSGTAGVRANLHLWNVPTMTQDLVFVSATDIDSALGATMWTRKGTLSNTLNWSLMTAPKPVAHAYIS